MATVSVTTMSGLIEAFNNVDSDSTIEILNDLDFNEVIDDLRTPIRMNTSNATKTNIEINGNNHAIMNLDNRYISGGGTYGDPMIDILNCQNVKISDLNILNCDITSGLIASMVNTQNITLKNSVIQGKFKNAIFKGSDLTVRNSMITCSIGSSGTLGNYGGGYSNYWENCWVKADCKFTFDSVNPFWIHANTCYFEGNVDVTTATNPELFSATNSVINVHTSDNITYNDLSKFCNNINSSKPTIINSTFNPSIAELSSTAYNKLVSDTQMKDAEYLASIGFDIIP